MDDVLSNLIGQPVAQPPPGIAPAPVIRHLSRAQLAELLLSCEVELAVDGKPGDMLLVAMYRGMRFVATLLAEARDHPGEYIGFRLMAWAPAAGDQGHEVAAMLGNTLPMAQTGVDLDGDLTITQTIALTGGVTAEHLRAQVVFWQQNLRKWSGAIARHPVTSLEAMLH